MKHREAGWTDEAGMEYGHLNQIFFRAVQVANGYRSTVEGRPVFTEKTYITKLVPGDTKVIIDRPMRDQDKEDYPVEWARWEQKKTNTIPGIPLDSWIAISDTQKAEFKALNITTIDQFAQLPDSSGLNIMGFNELREKARALVLVSKDATIMSRMRDETDAKIAAQELAHQAELKKMRDLILEMGEKRKPGRPRKAQEEVPA